MTSVIKACRERSMSWMGCNALAFEYVRGEAVLS